MGSEKQKNLSVDEKIDGLLCLEKSEKKLVIRKTVGHTTEYSINLEYVNVLKCLVMNFRTCFLETTENEVGIVKNFVPCGVPYQSRKHQYIEIRL